MNDIENGYMRHKCNTDNALDALPEHGMFTMISFLKKKKNGLQSSCMLYKAEYELVSITLDAKLMSILSI